MGVGEQTVILHISDLHFGWGGEEKERAERQLALGGLLNQLHALEKDWTPNIVCISGDIGWRGLRSDYEEAKQWIQKLLEALGLSPESLFLCPGNHDLDRNKAKLNARPPTPEEADQVLGGFPIPEHFRRPFQEFSDFCKEIGVPPFSLGEHEQYLVGQRSFQNIRVVSCNSAWFCKGDDDKGKLWIGLPQLKFLESHRQLPRSDQLKEWPVTIVLMHHPKEWFHEAETQAYGNRPNTFDYLSQRCHLLLTGHTHGEPRRADRFAECAWHLSGGAAYAGAGHFNSFRLIRIENKQFVYRSFEYNPRSSDTPWQPAGAAQPLSFSQEERGPDSIEEAGQKFNLSLYQSRAFSDAERFIEAKSRAIKPFGSLPSPLPLHVSIHDKGTAPDFTREGKLVEDPKARMNMPLSEAVRRSRRTLLLGDLGSGKSTLAGLFVVRTLEENAGLLACLIPAKELKAEGQWTVRSLLRAASNYFNEQIAPRDPELDFEEVLQQQIETVLVVDGLDEIPVRQTAELLNCLGALADHWSNIQIIVTGRPVELLGVNYEAWQILSTITLTDDEKFQLLEAEALANSKTDSDAREEAEGLFRRLKNFPILDSLATTPLTVRLLHSQLLSVQQDPTSQTLGDLLYQLTKERLGRWAKRDNKPPTISCFESEFPDEDSRIALLGRLAFHSVTRGDLTTDEARLFLKNLVKRDTGPNEQVLANEALQFYLQSGVLVQGGETLEFSIQPFLEFLCGYGLAFEWKNTSDTVPQVGLEKWRPVSFAGTTLRRLGLMDTLRSCLVDFLQRQLVDEQQVPAAAYVVSETQDQACAEVFITEMEKLGPRPLRIFFDDRNQSARAIAESIRLAKQTGFDWLFEQYLNPRYPTINAGSMIIDTVFSEWVSLSFGHISNHEKERLNTLVLPHLGAGTHQIIRAVPLLSFMIPDSFQTAEKVWFWGTLLGKSQFSDRADEYLRQAFGAGHETIVNETLTLHASQGYENAVPAALLWLELNENRPPAAIIKALIRVHGRSRQPANREDQYIDLCVSRIGQQSWEAFLRWCLFDDDHHLAAGAAIELHSHGERRLSLLGESLLRALHDGGYVRRAEEILSELIHADGLKAVKWLAAHIAATERERERTGAHSGWWRIFLIELPLYGSEGPSLLAKCVGGVGCFLLPRYPEVRQYFRDLLNGSLETEYRSALREQLDNWNPTVRHGAAMILLVSAPHTESRALEIVVQSQSRESFGNWHEWEQFCLKLSFGPSVLSYLESKLSSFDPSAEVFALAILDRGGVKLDAEIEGKLVKGLLELGYWALDTNDPDSSILARPSSLQSLLQAVEEGIGRSAAWSARKILQHHNTKISQLQSARCACLTLEEGYRVGLDIDEQISRLEADKDYADAVKEASNLLVKQGGKRPLLDLIRVALVESQAWEEVVWRLLCDNLGSSLEQEDSGQWLLDCGRKNPQYGRSIGEAASKFLSDPRVESFRQTDSVHWLAILGDEFANLSEERLEAALVHGQPIRNSAASALIARLGRVPSGFHKRDAVGSVPPHLSLLPIPKSDPSVDFDNLKTLARQAEQLHPEVCVVIEKFLFEPPLNSQDLTSLSAEGLQGTLIASALSVVYGLSPSPEFVLRLLSFWPSREQTEKQCFKRLTRMWRNGHFLTLESIPNAKAEYIRILDQALISGANEIAAVAEELLSLRGNLLLSQIPLVFAHYAENPAHHDYNLGFRLIQWLSSDLNEEEIPVLIGVIEKSLAALDGQPWDFSDGLLVKDTLRFLLLPIAYWKLVGKASELSIRVFLRGIKFLFARARGVESDTNPMEIMAELEPLLSQVPKPLMNEAIFVGQTSDDPTTRSLCLLFSTFKN